MTNYVNPYSFVSFSDELAEGAEHPPLGHDRARPGGVSGKISVTFEAVTPLLFLDDSTKSSNGNPKGHWTYGVRRGPDGQPLIPITGIKGALRSAYEAVTDSRMGVFGDHTHRLGYRKKAREGAGLVPVRVADRQGKRVLEILRGVHDDQRARNRNTFVSAAFVSTRTVAALAGVELTDVVESQPAALSQYLDLDGVEVEAEFGPFDHLDYKELQRKREKITFTGWRVTKIKLRAGDANGPDVEDRGSLGPVWKRMREQYGTRSITGYLSVTGPKTAQRKHEERVCFTTDPQGPEIVPLTDEVAALWQDVMTSYERANDLRPYGNQQVARPSQDGIQPAAHLLRPERRKLVPGRLALARLGEGQAAATTIEEMNPVAIGRGLYESPPSALVPDHALPIASRAQASPADRLFGFVVDGHADSAVDQAARGSLRIESVSTESKVESFGGTNGDPLDVLGSPKPSNHRFYLGERRNGETTPHTGSRKSAYSTRGTNQVLRGRKFYWHHRADDNWRKRASWNRRSQVDQRGRTIANANQRDDQNRSIREWLAPGTTITVTIRIDDAETNDIAALVWLLSQARIDDDAADAPAHLRFGYGKPLGFGSCAVNDLSVDLVSSRARVERWRSLGSAVPDHSPLTHDELCQAFAGGEMHHHVREYLRIARGPDGPIGYPRADEESVGFQWFMDNEKRSDPTSLPAALDEEQGLRTDPPRPRPTQRTGNDRSDSAGRNQRRGNRGRRGNGNRPSGGRPRG